MTDIILEYPKDQSWGEVEETDKLYIIIKKEKFAPGLWAGIKNKWFKVINPKTKKNKGIYLVWDVDLNQRKLHINNIGNTIESGDQLFLYEVQNGK